MECPYCKKEIDEVNTYYEVDDGDGQMLQDDLDSRMTDILKGEKEIIERGDFYCPHCKATLAIIATCKVEEVNLELMDEPDEE